MMKFSPMVKTRPANKMPNKEFDSKVKQVLSSNEPYFRMLQQWHDEHGGLAVEQEVDQMIEARCNRQHLVLEAGSGAGNITNWYALRFPSSLFFGVDISLLGTQMAIRKSSANARFQVADLKALPFKDCTFGFIFSQSVIEHVVGW